MAGEHLKSFIGKKVSVTKATNETYNIIQGVIIDETKNTFIIEQQNQKKIILKKGTTFNIEGKIIEGDTITKRIEDRIKSRRI